MITKFAKGTHLVSHSEMQRSLDPTWGAANPIKGCMRLEEILEVDLKERKLFAHASHVSLPTLEATIYRKEARYVFPFDEFDVVEFAVTPKIGA